MVFKATVKGMDRKKNLVHKKGKRDNSLPEDEYKELIKPVRILVRETPKVKQYLVISVKRFGGSDDTDDIENPVYVYTSMYQESEKYTGFLKGKTNYFPLEMLYDIIDQYSEVSEECDRSGIV